MYFTDCNTLEQIRARYKELAKQHHPDLGGDTATMQAINAEYDTLIHRTWYDAHTRYQAEHGNGTSDSTIFASMLSKLSRYNCRIEIIGYWLYCFDAYSIKDDLKSLGLWYSSKHKAWVYSGRRKINVRSHYSTDEIRYMHGSKVIKEREEYIRIV